MINSIKCFRAQASLSLDGWSIPKLQSADVLPVGLKTYQ